MQTRPESPNPRAARACGRVVAVLTLLALAAVLSACGSNSSSKSTKTVNVDTAKVARSIEQSIFAQRQLRAKVVCPAAVPQEQGRTFECVASTPNAKNPKRTVTTQFV